MTMSLKHKATAYGDADVAVSYAGWTLTVDQAGIDNLFDDTDGAQDVSISGSIAGWSVAMTSDQEGSTSSYKVGGNVAGVALTFTGTDNDDAVVTLLRSAASYAMGNGLTVSALSRRVTVQLKTTHSWLLIRNGRFDCWLHNNQARSVRSFGDEWDFSVKYSAGAWLHLSQSTKQTRLQSSLITHSVAAHLLSQQCTTKLVQQRPDNCWFELRILSETNLG